MWLEPGMPGTWSSRTEVAAASREDATNRGWWKRASVKRNERLHSEGCDRELTKKLERDVEDHAPDKSYSTLLYLLDTIPHQVIGTTGECLAEKVAGKDQKTTELLPKIRVTLLPGEMPQELHKLVCAACTSEGPLHSM